MKKREVHFGRNVHTLESACVGCGKILDGAFGFDFERRKGPAPKPGDVSLCFYCGTPMVWEGDDMRLRAPTAEEAATIAGDERVQLARQLIKEKDRTPESAAS